MSKTTIGFILGNFYFWFTVILFDSANPAFLRMLVGISTIIIVGLLYLFVKKELADKEKQIDKFMTWLGWEK